MGAGSGIGGWGHLPLGREIFEKVLPGLRS